MVRNISTYKSLDEIKAIDFYNIRLLNKIHLIDKNYKKNKKYHSLQVKQMMNDWYLLCDEYFRVLKDQKGKNKLRKSAKKQALLNKIAIIDHVIFQISYTILHKNLLPLSALNGFITQTSSSVSKIDSGLSKKETEDVYDWINRIRKFKDGLITRHSLSERDLSESQDILNKDLDISVFYNEKAYLEAALEKNHIPEDICMMEWVIYKNQVFEKVKKNG